LDCFTLAATLFRGPEQQPEQYLVTPVKSGKENAGEKCGTTGNKREYKMRDLIATTARRHEHNADDVS